MKFKARKINSKTKNGLINIPSLWKRYESKILKEAFNLTRLSVKTDKITCYIDSSTTNGYYGSRTITLGVKGGISKDDALMVITHELFHIFYWKKLKEMKLTKSSPGKESKKEWEIAEVAAYLLTKEPSLTKYWPKAQVYIYPKIKKTYKKVKKFWNKGDLECFLNKSYNKVI